MKFQAFGILFTLVSLSLAGQQSIDLVTLSGRYGFQQGYKNTYDGKAEESALLFNIKIPIRFNTNTIWYNDLTYVYTQVNNENPVPDGIADPIQLHGFILQTGLVKQFNNGTALQLLLAPRFMTDFENVSSKNWQLGGIGLFEKQYSNDLMLRYGALYNQELFGPILTPLVYVNWQFTDKWSLSGLLPIYAKLNYLHSENLTLGFSHFGLTTTYRLGNPAYEGDYIERTSIDLSLFARQRIAGNLHLEAKLGHTLNRKYAQYEEDQKLDLRIIIFNIGDGRIQKNVNFKDGPIANLRLVYNLPIPE